jgi:uncharacterized protein
VLALVIGEISPALVFAASLASALILGGSFFLLGVLPGKVSLEDLGLRPARWQAGWLAAGLALALIFMPVRSLLGVVVELLILGDLESLALRTRLFTGVGEFSWPAFLLSLAGIGLIVPVAEELYFRGLLHGYLMPRTRLWPRLLLTSLIFGLAHFDSLAVVISSFILGLINALALEKTRSLWLPILIHAVTNLTGVSLIYLSLLYS